MSTQRYATRLGLFVGLLFDQTSTLCGNVVLHYHHTSTKWWRFALGLAAAAETILIAYVASTMRFKVSQLRASTLFKADRSIAGPRCISSLLPPFTSDRDRGCHHGAFLVHPASQEPDQVSRVPGDRDDGSGLSSATGNSLVAVERLVWAKDDCPCNAASPSTHPSVPDSMLAVGVDLSCEEARFCHTAEQLGRVWLVFAAGCTRVQSESQRWHRSTN
jgi:hypothetical protein